MSGGYQIPDYIGKVAGFRRWWPKDISLDNESIILSSLYNNEIWDTRPKEAKCYCTKRVLEEVNIDSTRGGIITFVEQDHTEISSESKCGIYGWDSVDALIQGGRLRWLPYSREGIKLTIPGISSHWGKIIVSEFGIKSEYAQIEALYSCRPIERERSVLHNHAWEYIRSLGIPLISYEDTQDFLEARELIPQEELK